MNNTLPHSVSINKKTYFLLQWKKIFIRDPKRLRVRSIDRILFTKRLALYLRSGIPIAQALYFISEGAPKSAQLRIVHSLIEDVRRGLPLSSALSLFPRAYKAFPIQIIAAGEASGTLADNLFYLSDILTRQAQLSRKIVSALIYPLVILIGTLLVSGFLVLYAFPKIVPLFKGFHATLPLTTRILIWISETLQKNGFLIAGTISVFICISIYLFRIPTMRKLFDNALLRIPIFGTIIQSYHIATTYRMLSILLTSGMRIDAAVLLIQKGLTNTVYKSSYGSFYEGIIRGERMTEIMRHFPIAYPLLSVQLISAGERTGTLSSSAQSVAQIYEEDLDERTRALSSLLEPILMVGMGLVVGFVALAIITPMYGLTQSLSTH